LDSPRWLLLGHQLPTRSSNARVKTWRRLQQIGAVPARSSVYVLPNTEQCREDFEWIRSEIVALGGDATVFAADAISVGGSEDIEAVFRRTREQEYRMLKGQIDRLLSARKRLRSGAAKGRLTSRSLRLLRDRLSAIERLDFFRAPGRAEAAAALASLELAVSGRRSAPRRAGAPRLSAGSFTGRRWVTRPRPGVDRMACAWLIRAFIDPDATFGFTEQPAEADIAFDMYAGEFSHHGDSCTFEVLVERFGLDRPALLKVGQVVHDLDMKDGKYGIVEAVAVGRIVEGLRTLHADDPTLLEHGSPCSMRSRDRSNQTSRRQAGRRDDLLAGRSAFMNREDSCVTLCARRRCCFSVDRQHHPAAAQRLRHRARCSGLLGKRAISRTTS
jgi:hypothetical protein